MGKLTSAYTLCIIPSVGQMLLFVALRCHLIVNGKLVVGFPKSLTKSLLREGLKTDNSMSANSPPSPTKTESVSLTGKPKRTPAPVVVDLIFDTAFRLLVSRLRR